MIDVHCHLDDVSDAASAVARARRRGVDGCVMAATDPPSWAAISSLADAHEGWAWPAYGLHPWHVVACAPDALERDLAELAALLDDPADYGVRAPVAVAEIGLDRADDERKAALPAQLDALERQLALAHRHDLPVALHVVRAHEEILAVLRDHADDDGPVRGLIHGFHGSWELARRYLDAGLLLSVGGAALRPSKKLRRTLVEVPLDRVLVETDAPNLRPPDESAEMPPGPALVADVVAAIAEIRGVDASAVAAASETNARALFRLDGLAG